MSYRLTHTVIRWASQPNTASGSALNMLLVLAHIADDDGTIPSRRVQPQAWFAAVLGTSKSTVRRAIGELVAFGVLEVTNTGSGRDSSTYRIDPAGVAYTAPLGLHARHLSGSTPHAGVFLEDVEDREDVPSATPTAQVLQLDDARPEPAPTELDDRIRIARRVFGERSHPPTIKFPAVSQMAARFLDAGWGADAVAAAMIAAPALTDAAIEFQLNPRRGRPTLKERTANDQHEGDATRAVPRDEILRRMRDAKQQ